MKTKIRVSVTLLVILLAIAGCGLFGNKEEPVARSYQTNCYFEQGGNKIVCQSGGSIELQSGAALVATPGATLSIGDISAGALSGDNLALAVPTAQTTATPGADVNVLAAGSAAILIRDAATPVAEWRQDGSISVDTVNEFTSASGVTIDSLLVKDGGVTGDLPITANADQNQLVVTGYTTQTNKLLLLEQSGGTDLFWVDNNGDAELNGTTPTLTIGDAGAEDTAIVFDGAAQDFYVGLYDANDDLVIGLGSAVGTTGIIHLDENQDVGLGGASAGAKLDVTGNEFIDGSADEIQLTVSGYTTQTSNLLVAEQSDGTDVFTVDNSGNVDAAGTIQLGTNNRYPLEFASSGRVMYVGLTSTFTGTTTILSTTHGATTNVAMVLCTINSPDDDAGDPFLCYGSVSDGDVTLNAVQDDGDAATIGGTAYYQIVGN